MSNSFRVLAADSISVVPAVSASGHYTSAKGAEAEGGWHGTACSCTTCCNRNGLTYCQSKGKLMPCWSHVLLNELLLGLQDTAGDRINLHQSAGSALRDPQPVGSCRQLCRKQRVLVICAAKGLHPLACGRRFEKASQLPARRRRTSCRKVVRTCGAAGGKKAQRHCCSS